MLETPDMVLNNLASNSTTDWLMVIITAIYAVFTLLILRSNNKSAKAAEAQLEESKKEFEEQKKQFEDQKKQLEAHHKEELRLLYKPILQLEMTSDQDKDASTLFNIQCPVNPQKHTGYFSSIIKLKNIGNGTAIDLYYTWEHLNQDNFDEESVPSINGIMSGNTYYIYIMFFYNESFTSNEKPILELHYSDILNNDHTQRIRFAFSGRNLIKIENDYPISDYDL